MPIGSEVKIGNNTKIYHPETSNIYGCQIGGECIIGSHVVIQKGAMIGNRVKIQSFVFIPEGVTIEDEVFVGPHVCFINDKYPRATTPEGTLQTADDWEVVSTIVRREASIGANATILCGIEIGERAMIAAGSVVVRNVPPWTIVGGNPARIIRKIKE